jgi:response regulator RpfG family c-di-GMP phosphodiesterase
LRHLSERWDGSGTPEGLAGPAIPATSRIVAVADAIVRADYDLAVLEAGAGTTFDPTVVAVAGEMLRQR